MTVEIIPFRVLIYSKIQKVIWSELVIDESDQTDLTIGIRQLNDLIAKDDRVKISLLNIGDGLTVVVKN
ncbi:unnamed protein product [Trichobilharzia regenti]|nr:unnamed protein product [Trichobilharzia regenti]